MKTIQILCLIFCLGLFNCNSKQEPEKINQNTVISKKPNQYITVLGIAQDAGYPHINCENDCCKSFYDGEESKKLVSCVGLLDLEDKKKYIFDATPDFTEQTQILKTKDKEKFKPAKFSKGEAGYYLFSFSTKDKFGRKVESNAYCEIFNPESNKLPSAKPSFVEVLTPACEPGENAKFLIGSGLQKQKVQKPSGLNPNF